MTVPALSLGRILAIIVLVLSVISLFVALQMTYFVPSMFILISLAVIIG